MNNEETSDAADRRRKTVDMILRDALAAMGDIAPETLPHRLRERLRAQAMSDREIDDVVAALARERASRTTR